MITFEQVSKRYGERLALDSVSWKMDEGECAVFLGHSGAGKTTLLRLSTHERQPSEGTVTVGTFRSGRLGRGHRALLRRTLGIIYEDFRLLNDRTVFENVALAVRIAGRFTDDEVIPRVMYALEEVGMQLKQGSFPAELSAGEKQRCAIARAIVNRPAVILADEPTGALERKSQDEILATLRRIHGEGAALLLVTTRAEVAAAFPGARLMRIEDGKLVDEGGRPPYPRSPTAPHAAPSPPAHAPSSPPPRQPAPHASPSSTAYTPSTPPPPPAPQAPPSPPAYAPH